jgi:hypothetical protein
MRIALNVLRVIIFIPICLLAMSIVNWGLGHLMTWFVGLSKLWFIIVVFFFGGTIWGLFKLLASLLVMLAAYVSPHKWIGLATIGVLAIINGVLLGIEIWTLPIRYSGWNIFCCVMATLLVLELTLALVVGAASAIEEYE